MMLKFTDDELAAAFTDWQQRYRDDPDHDVFLSNEEVLAKTPEELGKEQAETFIRILVRLRDGLGQDDLACCNDGAQVVACSCHE